MEFKENEELTKILNTAFDIAKTIISGEESKSFMDTEYSDLLKEFAMFGAKTPQPEKEESSLQYMKMYFSKDDIANLVGVNPSKMAVVNVNPHYDGDQSIEVVVALDSSAEVKPCYEASSITDGTGNLRRQALFMKTACDGCTCGRK